jgi:hypothetical protein
MSESNKPKKKMEVIVTNPIEDAARVLGIPVEKLKKYMSDKPLRGPEPRKPPQGESGPAG